ncbi:MAG: helix-hairpin-helix domain-containing protein, partial [Roseimicrobium sp.]
MTAEQMANVLRRIAQLLELKGENAFKVRAYHTGAETVEAYSGDIVAQARAGKLEGIKGLGDALQQKLHELATTGRLEFYEKLTLELPETILELFEVQGLGAKKIRALHDELGVKSLADLRRVCEDGSAAHLTGFGEKTVEKLLHAISFRETHAHEFRQEQVAPVVLQVLDRLRQHPDVSRVEVAGSYRRGKETVHDLDFLVATKEPKSVLAEFVAMPGVARVLAHGETKASISLENGLQCDLRAVTNDTFACALVYFTGSKEHNIALRSRALERGWSLNEYAFTPTDASSAAPSPVCLEEADVYRALELDCIPPEIRENNGEITAAERGELPRLINLENLRGCFHNHTTASDGTATLREMAEAAHELGWQYLGIADHSKSSFQARGLDAARLRQQIADIRELNNEFASEGFRLFAGSEVDILKDGSLDFEDELLAELDYVVASVHQQFTLSEAEMTARIIKALENPYVTML